MEQVFIENTKGLPFKVYKQYIVNQIYLPEYYFCVKIDLN